MVRGYAGTYAYAKYGWQGEDYLTECNYVSTTTPAYVGTNIPFGHEVKVSAWSRKNNLEALYSLGDNEAKSTITKAYEGTFTVDFILGNGYFWKMITGNSPTETSETAVGGTKLRYKKYVDSGGSKPFSKHVAPFTIDVGITSGDDTDAGKVYTLIGCLAQSVKLSFSANEPIRVSVDGVYSDEKMYSIASANSASAKKWAPVHDTFAEPMAYQNASIYFPEKDGAFTLNGGKGIELEIIENSEITISNNSEALIALGRRKARVPVAKHMEYSVSISAYLTDKTNTDATPTNEETSVNMFIKRFYDKYVTETSTPNYYSPLDKGNVKEFDFYIRISNEVEENKDGHRGHVLHFSGCSIDSIDAPLDAQEVIKLDMNLIVRQIKLIQYTDETTAANTYLVQEKTGGSP